MVNSGPAMLRADVSAERGTVCPFVVAHVELPDGLRLGAVVPSAWTIDLPLAAEPVEVVDEAASQEDLERLVDVGEVDALLQHLSRSTSMKIWGTGCRNVVLTAASSGRFPRRLHELVDVLREEREYPCRPDPRG